MADAAVMSLSKEDAEAIVHQLLESHPEFAGRLREDFTLSAIHVTDKNQQVRRYWNSVTYFAESPHSKWVIAAIVIDDATGKASFVMPK